MQIWLVTWPEISQVFQTIKYLYLIRNANLPAWWSDQEKRRSGWRVRALTVMDFALRRRCVLHREQSVAEGISLSTMVRREDPRTQIKRKSPTQSLWYLWLQLIPSMCTSLIMDLALKPFDQLYYRVRGYNSYV